MHEMQEEVAFGCDLDAHEAERLVAALNKHAHEEVLEVGVFLLGELDLELNPLLIDHDEPVLVEIVGDVDLRDRVL